MEDIFKSLGRFLTRDVFYMLSGLYIHIALVRLGLAPDVTALGAIQPEVAKLIVILGSAYLVGFTVKEVFAFCHLNIEAHYFRPRWPEKILYRLHQRDKWDQPKRFDHVTAYKSVSKAGADVQSRYDRISDVIHICSTAGASLVVSGALLAFQDRRALLAAAFGVALILMSRFQAIRRMRFLARYSA